MADKNELLLRVGLQLDEVLRDFAKLNTTVGKTDDKLKKASKDWQKSFAKFGLAINGIEQGFRIINRTVGVAVRDMAAFQTEMVKVNTLVNLTTANFNRLSKSVINLSKEIPQTVEELSQGLYQVVSAGVDASKAMGFLEVSAKAATAGFTKTEVSVDAITSIINAFGKETDEAESVADTFFTTIRLGKTELELLSPTLGQFVPQAAATGRAFEEVASAMATLTKSGIPTARAATGIGRALTEMVKPGSKAERAIRSLGFASGQAGLDALEFQGVINALNEEGINLIEIFGDESARAVLTLANNSVEAGEDLDEFTKKVGAMNTAFELANDTLDNQRIILDNQLKALYLTLGVVVIPQLTEAVKDLNAVLNNQGVIQRLIDDAGDNSLKLLEARITALDMLSSITEKQNKGNKVSAYDFKLLNEQLESFNIVLEDGITYGNLKLRLDYESNQLLGQHSTLKEEERIAIEEANKAREEELELKRQDLEAQKEQALADEARAKEIDKYKGTTERTAEEAKFMEKYEKDRLAGIQKEIDENTRLHELRLRINADWEESQADALQSEYDRVDRLRELGSISTRDYLKELIKRSNAEGLSAELKISLDNQVEQLGIERFARLRQGWKEFLKGEIIDFITAKQVEMQAELALVWATGATTGGLSLAVALPMYGTGIAFLESAKQLVTKFFEGGDVDKPTYAILGEGGKKEFVAPERKFEEYSHDVLTPMILDQTKAALSRDNGSGLIGAGMKDVKESIDSLKQMVSRPYTLVTGTQLRAMNSRLNRGCLVH